MFKPIARPPPPATVTIAAGCWISLNVSESCCLISSIMVECPSQLVGWLNGWTKKAFFAFCKYFWASSFASFQFEPCICTSAPSAYLIIWKVACLDNKL